MHSNKSSHSELKKMTDAALIRLYSDDWNNLTPEGKIDLKAEISHRNLTIEDSTAIYEASPKKATHEMLFLKNAIRTKIPFTEITDYLKSNGLVYVELKNEASQLRDALDEKNKLTSSARLTGWAFLVIGLATRSLPYRHDVNPLFDVISYGLMLFGLLRWSHGWIGKKQSQQMLDYLKKWEQTLDQKPVEYWTSTSSATPPTLQPSTNSLSVSAE